MTIKAILFDKDGTLLKFEETFAPATARVIEELAEGNAELGNLIASILQFDLETETIIANSVLIAGSLDDIAEALSSHIKTDNGSKLSQRLDALYIKHSLNSLQPFDFLMPSLDDLKALGLPLGVSTNDSEEGALSHLNGLGIAERFCFIAGYNSGHGAKPQPGMVLAFAEQLDLSPHEVAMVGDSTHDCDAGRAAGALAIGVTSGGAEAEELAPYADYILPSIAELPELIAKLNA